MARWAEALVILDEVLRGIDDRLKQKTMTARPFRYENPDTPFSFSVRGPGMLNEITVIGSGDFSITIITDGVQATPSSFEEFKELSGKVGNISAFTDTDGRNVVNVKNIAFSNRLLVRVDGDIYLVSGIYTLVD